MAKVNVYDGETVIARVEYNNKLDIWDGHNWSSGSAGHHLGITRLKNGKFVLIHGTDWEGEQDYAEIVSDSEALQAILSAQNEDLLKKYFPDKAKELDGMEEE